MPRPCRSHDTTSKVVLQTAAAYEQSVDKYLSRCGRRRYRRPPLLRRLLALLPKQARLLDLGCGAGQDVRHLRQERYGVVGLDLTGALLAFARGRSPAVPLILADMRRLPLHRGSIDGIWAAASVIHLPKAAARALLVDLLDVIQPGGVLAATVAHGLKSRILKRGWIPGRYFARWTKAELDRTFRAAGWKVIELTVVTGQERKGRWINVIAQRPLDSKAKSSSPQ
jgi:SAM-dependent methyltransferase